MKLIKTEDNYSLLKQGYLQGSTNHKLIDQLNIEEQTSRYKLSEQNCKELFGEPIQYDKTCLDCYTGFNFEDMLENKLSPCCKSFNYASVLYEKKSEFDVEEEFKKVPHTIQTDEAYWAVRAGFVTGFNKALELTADKKYTEEDMRKAYNQGTNDGAQFESLMDYDAEENDEPYDFAEEAEKEFLQSLQHPLEIDVEIVMEYYKEGDFINDGNTYSVEIKSRPQLDSNGCIILKRKV